jgi:hypothetical protein
MKRYGLILAVAILSVINIVVVVGQDIDMEGKLSCDSLTGCSTFAHCPGRGTPSGCTIACDDQSTVICPHA